MSDRRCTIELVILMMVLYFSSPVVHGLTVAAGGDVMLGTDYPKNTLDDEDAAGYLSEVTPLLRRADIAFANYEGALIDGGEPAKLCSGRCYFFRSPTRYARLLAEAGFDLISLANNHARDFGEDGIASSQQSLEAVGIGHSGLLGTVARLERNEQRVGMIAFAPNPDLNPLLDLDVAEAQVEALAATVDIVIVSFHGGREGVDALHVAHGMEEYYGEERGDLRLFARTVIDAGADLVLGHGPHVPRGLELYEDRLIAYSLGNFATYFGISVAERKGVAPLLWVELASDGAFVEGRLHSFRQRRPQGPQVDPSQEALKLMQRLSREDFPGSPLRFLPDGRLVLAADPP
ncbi:MAG: CapA family protein [Pseudomonadota bacterium]